MDALNQLLAETDLGRPLEDQLAFDSLVSFYFIVYREKLSRLYYFSVDLQEPILMRCFDFHVTSLRLVNGFLHLRGAKYAKMDVNTELCTVLDNFQTEDFEMRDASVLHNGCVVLDFMDESVEFMQQIEDLLYISTSEQLLVYDVRCFTTPFFVLGLAAHTTVFYGNAVLTFADQTSVVQHGQVVLQIERRFDNVLQANNFIYAHNAGALHCLNICTEERILRVSEIARTRQLSNGIIAFSGASARYALRFEPVANQLLKTNLDTLQQELVFNDYESEFQAVQKIDCCLQLIDGILKQDYVTNEHCLVSYPEVAKAVNHEIAEVAQKYGHKPETGAKEPVVSELRQEIDALPVEMVHNSERERITRLIKRLNNKFAEYETLVGRIAEDESAPEKAVDEVDVEKIFYGAQADVKR